MRSFKQLAVSLALASFCVTGVAHATGGHHFGGGHSFHFKKAKKKHHWVPHFVFHPRPHKPPKPHHPPPNNHPPPKAVPELSAQGAGSALALLLGVGAVLTPVARRRLAKRA